MISCVVVLAMMALLLPGLSCRFRERPETSCTPSSVILTLSSRTLIILSARTESDNGRHHLNNRYQTQHGIIFNLLVCQLKNNNKSIYLLSVSSLILTKSTLNFVVLMNNENHAKLTAAGGSVIITITSTVVAPTALPVSTDPACRRATLVSPTLRK